MQGSGALEEEYVAAVSRLLANFQRQVDDEIPF